MLFEGAISADSPILEPPECFGEHMDSGFRYRAPCLELDGKGRHVCVIEGVPAPVSVAAAERGSSAL